MSHGTDIKELLQLPRHVRECPEVVTAIREIIEQDDEALQYYVRWMRFESLLRWTLQQTSLEQHLVVTEIRREHRRANWIRAAIVAFTLIAALTTVYGIAMLRDSLDPPVLPLVRTAGEWETSNPVIWENQDHPPSQIIQTGDRLSATHGSFLLRLKSGVTISCTAPIDLEVIDDWELFLHSGKAYAWVQPGGRGFRIRSPSVKIVDLGTVFGMTVNPDGSTEVQVIEGSVQAQSEKFEPQIIQGGTAYHVSSTGNLSLPRTVSSMEVKEQLSTLVGIQSLSGNLELRLSPPSSTLPHDLITRDGGCLFREQASIASNEEIELSTATPGRYSHKEPPARYQLPAGT
ncbi:MAG TPA: FecR family protein, partial [Planctomicrobium sp.]|nr:FecR family protein [Planctomicrobium sp.]